MIIEKKFYDFLKRSCFIVNTKNINFEEMIYVSVINSKFYEIFKDAQ